MQIDEVPRNSLGNATEVPAEEKLTPICKLTPKTECKSASRKICNRGMKKICTWDDFETLDF